MALLRMWRDTETDAIKQAIVVNGMLVHPEISVAKGKRGRDKIVPGSRLKLPCTSQQTSSAQKKAPIRATACD